MHDPVLLGLAVFLKRIWFCPTFAGCVCPVSLTTFSVRAFKNVVFTGLAASIVHCVHDIATRDRNDVVVDR